MAYNRPDPQVHHWLIPHKLLQCGLDSICIRVSQLLAIFFMQLGGEIIFARTLSTSNIMYCYGVLQHLRCQDEMQAGSTVGKTTKDLWLPAALSVDAFSFWHTAGGLLAGPLRGF
jgi:hypothetical protein